MLKKLLVTLLLINLLIFRAFGPSIAFAQQVTDTPTPTDSPTPTDTPATTPTPTDTSTPTPTDTPTPSITQSTVADTPTPTPSDSPTPSDTLTPTPTTDVTATNSGQVANDVSSTGNSGNNNVIATDSAVASDSATPTDSPDANNSSGNNSGNNGNNGGNGQNASINTGNSVAVTSGDTSVNVNNVNSKVVMQTINIFATQNGPIDLSAPGNIAANIILNDKNNDPVINVAALSSNNYAYLSNNVINSANSGQNSASGSGSMVINTGNAYSIVSLVNKVNFTIVDSVVHIIVINIFGTLNGNIILPAMPNSSNCADCGLDANINNTAVVNNTVNSQAISGENTDTIDASGSASISTGFAKSVVNLENIVNKNVIGIDFEHLLLNDFGIWNGNFAGWDNFVATSGARSLLFNTVFPNGEGNPCPDCFGSVSIQNTATVNNTVSSGANSGQNTINGTNGKITTGNAYSVVSLFNFVNINFIRTFGFFGFINVFGNWNGNLGDQNSLAPTPTPTPVVTNNTNSGQNSGPSVCVGTSSLETGLSSNINNFVYPGDSVLFFITLKNTGTAPLNNIKLKLTLSHGNTLIGGTILSLTHPLLPQTGEKITANLGLSPLVPPGAYTAHVDVVSNGCNSDTANGSADTSFTVAGGALQGINVVPQVQAAEDNHQVLGTKTAKTIVSSCTTCKWWELLLVELILLGAYTAFARRKKLFKGKQVILWSIPVLTYVLFLLVNKGCVDFGFLGFIRSGSIYCKFFWVWDLGLAILYIVATSERVRAKLLSLLKK